MSLFIHREKVHCSETNSRRRSYSTMQNDFQAWRFNQRRAGMKPALRSRGPIGPNVSSQHLTRIGASDRWVQNCAQGFVGPSQSDFGI
jgi:hypothetical protein